MAEIGLKHEIHGININISKLYKPSEVYGKLARTVTKYPKGCSGESSYRMCGKSCDILCKLGRCQGACRVLSASDQLWRMLMHAQ